MDDEDDEDDAVSDDAFFDSEPGVGSDDELESAGDDAPFDFVPLVDDRSFLAQPEPLKWIAGETIALRSVPSKPQLGQKFGAGSLIPWITSVTCLQFEQT